MTGVSRKSLVVVGAVAAAGTISLVLVLTGALPFLPQSEFRVCAGCPPGPTFVVGNPSSSSCPSGGTFVTTGCSPGEFVYDLTIETSTVTFGDVLFHIETTNGTVYVATGGPAGFSMLDLRGVIVAQYSAPGGEMLMSSGWTYGAGDNATTPLTSLYTVLVDMGTTNPVGRGYSFVSEISGDIPGMSILPLD
jgi:hypothetical protein